MSNNEITLPKVLIVAEHASAVFGGEALIPFQYFKRLRQRGLDVHLLVHERTRAELSEAFPAEHARIHFVHDSLVNILCHKLGKMLPDRLAVFTFGVISHLNTQIRQRRRLVSLHEQYKFDIVHEPIPVSPKLPSMLFGLAVPVVIGPMNGGMDFPPNYHMDNLFERAAMAVLRWTASFWNMILPGKKQASLLLVANKRTYEALPPSLKTNRVIEFVENGVDLELFKPRHVSPASKTFRILHIGRLVDVKRVDLLIDACARLKHRIDFKLDLVGDGPLRSSLESLVSDLGLAELVTFRGRLAQTKAAALLRDADLMVLSSMRECGGAVVLEAMASGVPVIAARWGGPSDYMTEDTGILIPPGTPKTFVNELAEAMLWMAENPRLRENMGKQGRRRAAELYDWNSKAGALVEMYQGVLSTNHNRYRSAVL